jgi:hypothetical protein
MSEYKIELVLKNGHTVVGEAIDEGTALNAMDEAIRRYPRSHVRIRRGTTIIAERVPPRIPSDGNPDRG